MTDSSALQPINIANHIDWTPAHNSEEQLLLSAWGISTGEDIYSSVICAFVLPRQQPLQVSIGTGCGILRKVISWQQQRRYAAMATPTGYHTSCVPIQPAGIAQSHGVPNGESS